MYHYNILPGEKLCSLNNQTPSTPMLLELLSKVTFFEFDPGKIKSRASLRMPACALPLLF